MFNEDLHRVHHLVQVSIHTTIQIIYELFLQLCILIAQEFFGQIRILLRDSEGQSSLHFGFGATSMICVFELVQIL